MGFFVDFLDEAFKDSDAENKKQVRRTNNKSLNESKRQTNEELQLSGVKGLNGKRDLRYKRKENIKTSGEQRTGISGDRDMRENKQEEPPKYQPISEYGRKKRAGADDWKYEMREYYNYMRNAEPDAEFLDEDLDTNSYNNYCLKRTASNFNTSVGDAKAIMRGLNKTK